jgi:hypothetical protein
MNVPDYPLAAASSAILLRVHHGQHRCEDGNYYGPNEADNCPIQRTVRVLTDTIDAGRTMPHEAVHDPDVIDLVAGAMLSGPLHELDLEQQEAWRMLARLGLEEFCRVLDALRDDAPVPS